MPEKLRAWVIEHCPLLLIAIIGLSYLPVYRAEFVWDDDENILTNRNLHDVAGLVRIWTDPHSTQQYYPLTHTSFWVQVQTSGLSPLAFHLVNVALHATAAVFLLLVLRRLRLPGAEFAAFLFAVHPLNVESVAWVTERKNVLSGSLALASCWFYLRYDEECADGTLHPARRHWAIALLLFVLALAAKTAVAVLPAAMLVVLVGVRGRRALRAACSLAPFLVLGVAAGLGTAFLERSHVHAEGAAFAWSFGERVLIAGRAFCFYLQKLLVPTNLMFFYPKWPIDEHAPLGWLFPAFVVGVFAVLFAFRKQIGPGAFVALLAYAVLIFPALGFFNVYFMRFAYVQNHFQYLAGIPILALVAGVGTRALHHTRAELRFGVSALTCVWCASLSFVESRTFRDYDHLFQVALARNPSAWVAAYDLGLRYQTRGDLGAAITMYRAAAHASPEDPEILTNLGIALAGTGHLSEGLSELDHVLRVRPLHPESHLNLAAALVLAGRAADAAAAYRHALELRPHYTRAKRQLAWLLATTDDPQLRDGRAALELARSACAETVRSVARCQDTLAAAEAASGDFEAAATRAEKAAELARHEGQRTSAEQYEARARLYVQHRPYVEDHRGQRLLEGGASSL